MGKGNHVKDDHTLGFIEPIEENKNASQSFHVLPIEQLSKITKTTQANLEKIKSMFVRVVDDKGNKHKLENELKVGIFDKPMIYIRGFSKEHLLSVTVLAFVTLILQALVSATLFLSILSFVIRLLKALLV